MKLPTAFIQPIFFPTQRAFDRARQFYAPFENHPAPEKRLCFADDLLEYHRFGWVKSSPTSFAMARVINIAPEGSKLVEPAWFIRMAVGNMKEILDMLPGYLPKILWCRNNDGVLRIYSTERLVSLARRMEAKTNGRRR